ncbi:MAG: hypothetical protein Q7J19_06905 [Lutibacter sp.]|nr:hypothetical protein [Lutibacter sp.]
METSKNGYIRELRDANNNLLKEVKVKGSLYRYNSKFKTYNNVIGNELLHESSLEIADVKIV